MTFTVGQRVRCVTAYPGRTTVGDIYDVNEVFGTTCITLKQFADNDGWVASWFEPVAADIPPPADPTDPVPIRATHVSVTGAVSVVRDCRAHVHMYMAPDLVCSCGRTWKQKLQADCVARVVSGLSQFEPRLGAARWEP